MEINPIAYFHSPFSSKFGIPKQSGLVEELEGEIIFEEKFRNADALRGIDEFDYLWLIWGFSANPHQATSPMVRPPLLGGNTKVGVFASRSPFRPNALGLSSVRLSNIDWDTTDGPIIHVTGADLMDNTPIYDIKPYVAYADCHKGARSGFVDNNPVKRLKVVLNDDINKQLSPTQLNALIKTLELDPRPHYQNSPDRVYGMPFYGHDIHFKVIDDVVYVIPQK